MLCCLNMTNVKEISISLQKTSKTIRPNRFVFLDKLLCTLTWTNYSFKIFNQVNLHAMCICIL